MVCPVTTPFHSLYQAVAYLGFYAPGDKVSLGTLIQCVGSIDAKNELGVKGRRKLTRPPNTFCQ